MATFSLVYWMANTFSFFMRLTRDFDSLRAWCSWRQRMWSQSKHPIWFEHCHSENMDIYSPIFSVTQTCGEIPLNIFLINYVFECF